MGTNPHPANNTFRQEQNDCHFANDIFNCIFLEETFCILMKISFKYICKGLIYKKSALIQVMAGCWTGNKPLQQLMLT